MNSDRRRNNLPRNLSVPEILSVFPAFLIHLQRPGLLASFFI